MSKRLILTLGASIAVVAITGAAVIYTNGGGGSAEPADTSNLETVQVRDMVEVTTLAGTLGFPESDPVAARANGTVTAVAEGGALVVEGDQLFAVDGEPVVLLLGALPAYRDLGLDPVLHPVAPGRQGTVTSLPAAGDLIPFGGELLRIDDVPVILLEGDVPAWRVLRNGSTGRDVEQLEAALVSLGYDPDATVVVDEEFTAATEAMVREWQEASGLEVDGRFTPGDAVFLPGPAEIEQVQASVGTFASPTAPILTAQVGAEPIEGDDVRQLQEALVRLGHEVPVSGVFDEATRTAVTAWQRAVGAEPDGVVHLGEVVFLPEPVRVTDALVTVGRPVSNGTPVLATTGSSSVVLLGLPADDQSLLAVEQTVTVELPDGSEAEGVVVSISGVATRLQTGAVVFETTIELLDATVGADLDQAPVDVHVVTDSRQGVTAVPVTSLLALAEGGYAVEVSDGAGATRLVPVTPGLYADGWVEVSSDGLAPGDEVVVP
ncbi:MAG: peptidoglycan-binding protein [Acidimicrobiia bacterium]|nr:MAG: peptidoglycan-binding protein [Acidimicrobiia bacterium]